jgi:predicted CXXCH cytochrome family protein
MIAAFLSFCLNVYGFDCKVCHSKNPKMVKMHQELGYRDCFKCHGLKKKKSPEELKQQMATDQLCIGCHGKK